MSIVANRKAYHDYFIEEKLEAGLSLQGWEVKAIRAGRAQLKEAYVIVKDGEILLIGAHITPLSTASTHIQADPVRTRRLLLHRNEINRLVGQVERAGYTLMPLDLHYSKGTDQARDRPRQGQEAVRQAGDGARARVEPRAAAAAAPSHRPLALRRPRAARSRGATSAAAQCPSRLRGRGATAPHRRFERRRQLRIGVVAGDVAVRGRALRRGARERRACTHRSRAAR